MKPQLKIGRLRQISQGDFFKPFVLAGKSFGQKKHDFKLNLVERTIAQERVMFSFEKKLIQANDIDKLNIDT